jgi:hypothetical protein
VTVLIRTLLLANDLDTRGSCDPGRPLRHVTFLTDTRPPPLPPSTPGTIWLRAPPEHPRSLPRRRRYLRPSRPSPGRLAAAPSARASPPTPARLSPRRLTSPHLTRPTGQFPSPARKPHAMGTGHRTPARRSASAPALQVLRRRLACYLAHKRSVVRK